MRLINMIWCDIKYQIKYGFYFIYSIISLFYIAVLFFIPKEIVEHAAAIIVLSDPAAIGFFFIGGIILLERDEGIHGYFSILPLTNREYIISKVISLSIISTLVGVVVSAIALGNKVNYVLLFIFVFVGASVFTLMGIAAGSVAKSVNQYFMISIPISMVFMAPVFLIYFGINNVLVELLPSTLIIRGLYAAFGMEVIYSPLYSIIGLVVWFATLFRLSVNIVDGYIERIGG